jgi:hypothetical protein
MENIIINFSADPAGLQPGINALGQLEEKDKAVAEQAKKTMSAYNSRDKAIQDTGKSAKKSVDDLATSMKGLDKSIVGGVGGKALADLRNSIKLTDNQWKQFYQNLIKTAKVEIVKGGTKEDIEQLNQLINGAENALLEFGKAEDKATEKSKSMKAQLRELKTELQEMENAGQDNTAQFEQMQIKAGKLEDQIGDTNARIRALGSDTFVFDALISGISGLTGAFAAAQGAAALFGDENEDIQQALLKVNAAMSILQGLQAVQNVLQKQSAASIAVDLLLRRNQAAATKAQTAATEENIVATETAAVAQKGLNLAFLATPTGLILTGIAAITTAIFAFGSSAEASAKKYRKLQESLKEQLDFSIKATDADPALKSQDQLIKSLEKQIETRKAAGASDAEIALKQNQLTDARIHREETVRQSLLKTAKDLGISYGEADQELAKLYERQKNIIAQQRSDASKRPDDFITGIKQNVDANTLKRERQNNDSRIALLEQFTTAVKTNNETLIDLSGQREEQIADIEEKGYLNSLKSARAFAEQKVIIAKDGSKEELDAQIKAIHARTKEELADVNLTRGERAKILAAQLDEIEKLQNAFDVKAIRNAQTAVEARVVVAKKGSKEEFDLKIESLKLGHAAEIADKNKSVEELKLIDAKYLSDRLTLAKEFNRKTAEDTINARIAELNSTISILSLTAVDENNRAILDAKKNLIDEQAALEVIGIQYSVENEELKRKKIQAVYDKELADKRELEKQKTQAEIESILASAISAANREISKINKEASDPNATEKEKEAAAEKELEFEEKIIEKKRQANFDLLTNKSIDNDEFRRRENDNDIAQDEIDIKREQLKQDKITKIREFAQQTAVKLINFAFEISKRGYDNEKQQIQDLFEQKNISQTEYNNRLKQLRRKQAEDDKAQAVFATLIQQGPAILQGFKTGGLPGIIAATTLFFTLLNAVTRTSVPQFKTGKVRIAGPGTDTSDSITARISRNESVINARQTLKHEEALRAINEDRYQDYLMNNELPRLYQNLQMPVVPEFVSNVSAPAVSIDYDRIGESVAHHIAANPQAIVSIDEDGFKLSIKKGNQVIEYKNKKLTT